MAHINHYQYPSFKQILITHSRAHAYILIMLAHSKNDDHFCNVLYPTTLLSNVITRYLAFNRIIILILIIKSIMVGVIMMS
jgi:hypothetical protein